MILVRLLLKPFHIVFLVVYFAKELILSAVRVFIDVLTPGLSSTPRFVAMPLDAKTDLSITMTANLITLTPGTLTVDVSDCRRYLLIHAMYAEEGADAVNASLKNGMERMVIRATE
ncbi:MAG: Na+/H+ antiporter subunit E [Paracoccaceae bacterium]